MNFWRTWRTLRKLSRGGDENSDLHDWLESISGGPGPFEIGIPWMTYGAIHWLEQILSRRTTLFEYGSGGSTIFFAHRVAQIVSVEHDAGWYEQVRQRLNSEKLNNCEYHLRAPGPEVPDAVYGPGKFNTTDPRLSRQSFEAYVRSIEAYPDKHFDVIVVDGRSRASCLAIAIPKLKPEGWLVLDNSEREEYQPATNALPTKLRRDFCGVGPVNAHPWMTSAFQLI